MVLELNLLISRSENPRHLLVVIDTNINKQFKRFFTFKVK